MNAIDIALVIAAIAGLAVTALLDRERLREALAIATANTRAVAPAVVLMTLAAALLLPVVPTRLVSGLIGPESGVLGVLVGALVGGIIPGGPMVSFPIVVVLQGAGAGQAQLIALLSAWSAIALHRVAAFELPMMGPAFVRHRLVASLPLPVLAGLAALVF